MTLCELCPRRCRVDRSRTKGRCGVGEELRVARAALHAWEEPCLSGERGSGTIFFAGCPLGCVYCQNRKISRGEAGSVLTVRQLAEEMLRLQAQGAHNINLVTPTHYVPGIIGALEEARRLGMTLPVVYNTSGYERVETLRRLEGLVDIWLPDCKYASGELARRYSGAEDYPQVAMAALEEMVRQQPRPVFDEEGMMTKGVIVRLLLLPGCLEDAKEVVRRVVELCGDRVYLSLMNQYTPMPGLEKWPELQRKVTGEEYEQLVDFALELGVTQGFIQEGETAQESFIPDFSQMEQERPHGGKT
ncbi:MAG: radical SAM protein [Eubacteriales bacterium]|jgi:putative pyruvate formate lyase activating enzyme